MQEVKEEEVGAGGVCGGEGGGGASWGCGEWELRGHCTLLPLGRQLTFTSDVLRAYKR